MKRRFAETLLTVAIAAVGASAYAMAPTISSPGIPVISDDNSVTDDNNFVYPDPIDLDVIGNDPDGTVAKNQIIWSYSGTGRILINGVAPIDPEAVSPNAPGEGRIDTQDNDPAQQDDNPRTITLRDAVLSPIGGPNTDPRPGQDSPAVVNSEIVTLYASDGSAFGVANMLVYTEDDGEDRMSNSLELVRDVVPANQTGANAWTSQVLVGAAGAVQNVNNQLCITAALQQDTFAQWVGPYGFFDLVQNQVYRIRLSMGTNNTTIPVNTGPLWDFFIDNFDMTVGALDAYGFDFLNYDNEGGANSVTSLDTFDVWFTPMAVQSARWNDPVNGVFTAANDPKNDARVTFRVLDAGTSIDAASDQGTICLERIQVHRMPFDALQVVETLYQENNLTNSNYTVSTTIPGATSVQFTNGDIVIAPTSNTAWEVEVINVDPGNTDISTEAERRDNWPIPWVEDQLLIGRVGIQAQNATAETTPPDVLMLTVDSPTTELFWVNQIFAGATTAAFPVANQETEYVTLVYTHAGTASAMAGGDGLRLRTQIVTTPTINAGGNTQNPGGVIITRAQVDRLAVPE